MTANVSSQLQRILSNNKINDSTNIGIIIHRLWNYKPSNGYTIGNERILFGIIELFIFTLGVPGSMIVLSYFILKSKEKTASTLLYALISTLDLTICVLCLTMAITDLTGEAVMFGSTFYCHVWGYLWDVSSKMSIFLIAVLSIARTISLTFPFFNVKRFHVAIPIIIYFVTVLVEHSLPFIIAPHRGYSFNVLYSACGFTIR